MMDYDMTNRGSLFKPRANETFLVQGKLDSNGTEHRLVIIKAGLPDGGNARDIYVKVGTLFENVKEKETQPEFSGPIQLPNEDKRRLACWKSVSKDGQTKYLSAAIGDKTPRSIGDNVISVEDIESNNINSDDGEIDDPIPF